MAIDRDTFITQYLAAFMATRAASIFQECCYKGDHSRMTEPPTEDESYLACCAWLAVKDIDLDERVAYVERLQKKG